MARTAEARHCKHCGKGGLYWRKVQGPRGLSIRLVNPVDGQVHYCDEYTRKRFGTGAAARPSVAEYQVLPEETEEKTEETTPEPEPVAPVKESWPGYHYKTPRLLQHVRSRRNVLLVGPAGTGKTHAASLVAKCLGLPYYAISVGPQTSKSDLVGYMDAQGRLVRTVLREAYEHGGVFLLDEMDAGNAGVLTILNALLANSEAAFPDGMVAKHRDFICIAAANTFGHGANRQYVGRQQLDAATLDRFIGIEWGYDRDFEFAIAQHETLPEPDFNKLQASVPAVQNACSVATAERWVRLVHDLRDKAERNGIRRVFGTRRIQQGIGMLRDGIKWAEVVEETVFFGVSPDDRTKLS